MAVPVEIIRGPVDLYVADAGTVQPELSKPVPATWTKLGASISDEGLIMNFEEEEDETTTLDSPMIKKLHVTRLAYTYTVALIDLTVETFARIQNGVAVISQAAASGTAGYREMTLGHGFTIKYYAILARGPSPYDEDYVAQQHFAYARVKLNEAPTYAKSGDAMLGAMIKPILDDTIAGYGRYRAQNAAPTN